MKSMANQLLEKMSKSSRKVNESIGLDFYITQVESKKKILDQQIAIVLNEAKKYVYKNNKDSGNYSTIRSSHIHKYLNELEAAIESLSDQIGDDMRSK